MKDTIITDPGRAYLMGIMTMALSMFLGYKWSPDYVEFVANGYNFLWVVGFVAILFIMMWLIDGYFETKRKKNDASGRVDE